MSSFASNFIRHNEINQAPVVRLGQPASAALRCLRRGGRIVSLNGSDWHCGALSFTEQCIDSVISAGLVTVVQCGPDLLLALHLELTAAYWQNDARPLPNPWSGSEYGAVYDKMHRLNRYAIRELTGVEQRNLLDAVQAAMNHTADEAKLRALDGIAHKLAADAAGRA